MHKITSEQMQKVLSVIGQPTDKQKDIFDSLELNPYDNYEDNEPDFKYLVRIKAIEANIEDLKDDLSYFIDSEERIIQIEAGDAMTSDEEQSIRAVAIENILSDDFIPMGAIAELSDDNESIFSLYIEQLQGQGALHIIGFIGFYLTKEEAVKALYNQKDFIVYH